MALILAAVITLTTAAEMTTGPLQAMAEGFKFTEGPLWMPKPGCWIFSDIPADAIYRADKTVYRQPSHYSNGLTLDPQGRLLAAEHETRRISRTDGDGNVTAVAERFEGKRFNSPNDVVVRSDGTVFFTDPPYGLDGGLDGPNGELKFAGVFAVTPKGEVKCLARDFQTPNGLAFSPDEKTLYVADTEADRIRAFSVAPDGTASGGSLFVTVPHPDGIKVDVQGNVWSTSKGGVRVFSPLGALIQMIAVPGQVTNCAFGGEDGKTLCVTTPNVVYNIRTAVAGIRPGPK